MWAMLMESSPDSDPKDGYNDLRLTSMREGWVS